MSYKVVATRNFEKELKALSKKYPSLKTEFPELYSERDKLLHKILFAVYSFTMEARNRKRVNK